MIEHELQIMKFKKGEYLFREGDKSFHFFILQEGEVEVFKLDAGGREISLAQVSAGHAIGEFAIVDRSPRSASVRALTDVSSVMVSEQAYQKLLQELPSWAIAMIEGLVDRLRQTNQLVQKLHSGEAASPKDLQALGQLDAIVEFDTGISTINMDQPPFSLERD